MKRYWKTILISLVIVMTISFYYIQVVIASKNDVSFTIETTRGSNKEIDHLILQARYSSGNIIRASNISMDGSSDRINQSFIDNIMPTYVPLMFQQHVKEHRNFMRGKDFYLLGQYNEDAERLIYATVLNKNKEVLNGDLLKLQIDILEKKNNESFSFEVSTSAQENYNWINILHIYSENGKIKILAKINLMKDGEELHMYTIDESKREIEKDAIIAKVEQRNNSFIRMNKDYSQFQNEKYYIYTIDQYHNEMEDAKLELTPSLMYVYNIDKDVEDEWTLPAEFKPYLDMTLIHGAYIYIPVPSAQGLELNRYNVEKMQWEEPLIFNYPSSASEEEIPLIKFINNKLYLVDRVSDGNVLIICDLNTGESLYEGKITAEYSERIDKDYPLYIEELYIMH